MSELTLEQRALALLEALGNTPNLVARNLLAGGHVGERNLCTRCPVAMYLLRSDLGADLVVVGDIEIQLTFLTDDGMHVETVTTPYPIRHFIHAFDAKLYPQLIAGRVTA